MLRFYFLAVFVDVDKTRFDNKLWLCWLFDFDPIVSCHLIVVSSNLFCLQLTFYLISNLFLNNYPHATSNKHISYIHIYKNYLTACNRQRGKFVFGNVESSIVMCCNAQMIPLSWFEIEKDEVLSWLNIVRYLDPFLTGSDCKIILNYLFYNKNDDFYGVSI